MKIKDGLLVAIISGFLVFSILSYKPVLFGILTALLVFIIIKFSKKIGLNIFINLITLFIFLIIVAGVLWAFSLNTVFIIFLFILGILLFVSANSFKKFPLFFPLLFFILVLAIFNFLYFKELKKFKKFKEENLTQKLSYADLSACEINQIYNLISPYFEEIKGKNLNKKEEIDWEKIHETISICLKNLEGEGFLSFKEEDLKKILRKEII